MQMHASHALMDIRSVREEHRVHAKHLNDLWSTAGVYSVRSCGTCIDSGRNTLTVC